MPYIARTLRPPIDRHVERLLEQLWTPGALNYAITRLAVGYAAQVDAGQASYDLLNEVDGVLGLVQAEFRRRIVFPYEDHKIAEAGDIEGMPPQPQPTPAADAQASRLTPKHKMRWPW